MSDLQDLMYIVKTYTRKKRTPVMSFADLEKYAGLWSMEIRKKKREFTDFSTFDTDTFINILHRAEKSGVCTLQTEEGFPTAVILNDYYLESVKKAFEDVEKDPEKPFPDEEYLGGVFPSEMITIVDVKTDFIERLKQDAQDTHELLRLVFPEGLKSIVTVSNLLYPELLQLCISKFRVYLNDRRNYDFIFHKLLGIFQRKDQNLKDMFTKIMSHRNQSITTIVNPDDFTFQFWSHFAGLVLKEFREKKDKLDKETSFSQAAYLLGFYNLYFKGTKRKSRDREAALKMVDVGLRKAPYLFTFSDIMGFRDKSGFPLSRKVDRKDLAAFLTEKSTPVESQVLPDILKFNSKDSNRDLFLNKEKYLSLTLRKIQEDGREMKKQYIEEWGYILGRFKRIPEMYKRDVFIADIGRRLNNLDPLLTILLRPDFLRVCLEETKPPKEIYIETERLFTRSKESLIPLDEIFRLDRHALYADAKATLPLWKTLPLIGPLGMILKKIFAGVRRHAENIKDPTDLYSKMVKPAESYRYTPSKPVEKTSSKPELPDKVSTNSNTVPREQTVHRTRGATSKEQIQNYREMVNHLKIQYVGEEGTLKEEADSLINQWNPLMEGKARDDLIEDVNSMIRDYLRGMRRGFSVKPPDKQRIRNIAEHLGENSAFDKIKKKDAFMRYIEVYIVQQLAKK